MPGKHSARGSLLTPGSQLHSQVGSTGPLPGSQCFPTWSLWLPLRGWGLEWVRRAACRPYSHGDACGGDSFSQPLGCTVNRPQLCDLPRGENSSCGQPSPGALATEHSSWTRGPRGPAAGQWRQDVLLGGVSLRCLSPRGPHHRPWSCWQAGTEGPLYSLLALTFQRCHSTSSWRHTLALREMSPGPFSRGEPCLQVAGVRVHT